MKSKVQRLRCFILLAAAVLATGMLTGAHAESFTANIMRLLNYEGDVYILDADGNYRFLLEGVRFNSGESLNTSAGSMASVELDAAKVLTLDSLTQVTFAKENNQMRMNLATGRLLLDVREKLDENEALDIQTSTMTVGIRGTVVYLTSYDTAQAEIDETIESNGTFRELLATVLPKGYQGNYSQLVVLEGKAVATYTDHQGQTRSVEVHAGEKITVVDANLDQRADEGVDPSAVPADRGDLGDDILSYISGDETLLDRVKDGSDLLEPPETDACTHRFELYSRIDPTCTEEGEEVSFCADCGEKQTAVLPATGHNWGGWRPYRAATTEAEGLEIRYCRNDPAHVSYRDIPKHVHTPAAAVTENETAASCTSAGSLDSVVYCAECGQEISRTAQTIAALGHDFGEWTVTTEPSCTEAGQRQRACRRTDCGSTETEEIPAPGHSPITEGEIAATCTESGWTAHIYCSVCEEVLPPYQTEIPALGHDFGEWVVTKEPTCTETGLRQRSCSRCDFYEVLDIEAAGHTVLVQLGKDATCTEAGRTEATVCGTCGAVLSGGETIPALGGSHDYGWVSSGETELYDEDGVTVIGHQRYHDEVCSRCGDFRRIVDETTK